jgi:aspartate/methionine/tyrosine aminotransferase
MSIINEQAKELNEAIRANNPTILNLFSEKGKASYFPKSGIIKQTAEAKGKKFNATIGMAIEDDGTPMRLPSIAKNINLDPRDAFPYAPSYGAPELRKIWQQLIREKNPSLRGNISLPVITNALTNALSIVGMLFVDPGDRIIITDKFWGNYRLIFEIAHWGVLDTINTFTQEGLDLESFQHKLNEGTGKKIILLNFPNNPAGYTPTENEASDIAGIIKKSAEQGNEIAVMIDDAYFGLVYQSGIFKESLFAKLADLHENVLAIKIDGATKEDYTWGLRVGFITYAAKGIDEATCQALEAKTGGAVRGNISNASHLSQSLVYHATQSPTYWEEKKEKYELLKGRFETVQQVLTDNREKFAPFFRPLPYNSGYFMCVELSEKLNAEEVRQLLLKNYDTGLIAVGNLLRIAYSSIPGKYIPELFDNIYNACKEVSI